MAQRTRRLLNLENRENSIQTKTVNIPGKTVLTQSSVVPRRPALRDVGNKTAVVNDTTANKINQVAKKVLKKTTTTVTVTNKILTVREESVALKKPENQETALLKRQESILTRKRSTIEIKEEEAHSTKRFEIPDIDAQDSTNLLLVSEYVTEIYEYLKELENRYPIKKEHLANHKSTHRMRSVLVNWLVEVHMNFNLLQETLHVAIAIIDRYLQITPTVGRDNLQLVGVASLLAACKYEEMYFPEVNDFVYVGDNSYSREELLHMEQEILKTLGFELGRPLSLRFLRRYNKVAKASLTQHNFGKYLLEICLLEYSLCYFNPSLQAAAAVYLSLALIGNVSPTANPTILWNKNIIHYSGYEYKDIKSVVCLMACALIRMETTKYQQIREKYASSKYNKVSTRAELKGSLLKKLTQLI